MYLDFLEPSTSLATNMSASEIWIKTQDVIFIKCSFECHLHSLKHRCLTNIVYEQASKRNAYGFRGKYSMATSIINAVSHD